MDRLPIVSKYNNFMEGCSSMNFRQVEKTQPETVKIVKPFVAMMREKGWLAINIHGNQFQKGLPDYMFFRNGVYRWVEFKVCKEPNGWIKITDAQRVMFPKLIAEQANVYVVADYDLRNNPLGLKEHYKRVVHEKSNLHLLLDKRMFKYLPSGYKSKQ